MINQSFDAFANRAAKVRTADAGEHLREEKRRLDSPDLTVLDRVIEAGLSENSSMHAILNVLSSVPEAKSIYQEWVVYRWTLRQDERVHRRFFQHIEPMSLFPGDYTDACFVHATPANLYSNELWATCQDKPRRQPRLMALARGLVRRNAPTEEVAAANALRRQKTRDRLALNSDNRDGTLALTSVKELDDTLAAERVSAAQALERMRDEWSRATQQQQQRLEEVEAERKAVTVDNLISLLAECKKSLAQVAKCTPAKDAFQTKVFAEFTKLVRRRLKPIIRRLQSDEVDDSDVGNELIQARDEVAQELVDLQTAHVAGGRQPVREREAVVAALDWLQRDYIVKTRDLLCDQFTKFAAQANAMAGRVDPVHTSLVHRLLQSLAKQSASLVDAIRTGGHPQSTDWPMPLSVYALELVTISVVEHMRDVLFGIDVHGNPAGAAGAAAGAAAADPAHVRNQIVRALRHQRKHASERLTSVFTTCVQFVKAHVMDVELEDLDAIIVIDNESAAQLLTSSIDELTTTIQPRIKRYFEDRMRGALPSTVHPILHDFLPATAGAWHVDMDTLAAFTKDHLAPAVKALRPLVTADKNLQGLIWLGDADQLCNATTAPTFRRVFTAVRYVYSLQLSFEHVINSVRIV